MLASIQQVVGVVIALTSTFELLLGRFEDGLHWGIYHDIHLLAPSEQQPDRAIVVGEVREILGAGVTLPTDRFTHNGELGGLASIPPRNDDRCRKCARSISSSPADLLDRGSRAAEGPGSIKWPAVVTLTPVWPCLWIATDLLTIL